jgi:hypothetical protein
MTAEVVLLNKHAVALAADSAVTVTGARGNKIYNAANKLFALSKWEPVGVMVYGGAEYMGIPWETVLKIYRGELAKKSFPELEDYFTDLMRFLGENDALFGESAQNTHVRQLALRVFTGIKSNIRARLEVLLKAEPGKEITEQDVLTVAATTIKDHHTASDQNALGFGMDADFAQYVSSHYQSVIAQAINDVFEKLPLTDDDRAQLQSSIVCALTRDTWLAESPGVVVAGFGTTNHFPQVCATIVHGRVAGRLKRQETYRNSISNSNNAIVVPFAQTDAVELFVEGVDPAHAVFATKLMSQTLERFTQAILSSLDMNEADRAKAESEWSALAKEFWREFSEATKDARLRNYVHPLLDVIAVLPKDELAAVAEALVNITSLRRKVSMDAETVGGPIDVAVISKGDGLVWIHRKHYFKPELNPQFFENYFSDG